LTTLVFSSLLNGVVYGLLLFMLSSGLTLIFSMMGVLNFAHTSMFMLGAYFSFQVGQFAGFGPALVLAPLLVGLVGAGIERYGLRKVHRYGHVSELLFTFGLAYLIQEFVIMVWGRNPIENKVPRFLDFVLFDFWGVSFPAYKGFMMLVSFAMFGFLWWVVKYTRAGLVIQAALTHPATTAMLGHNVPRVFMLVFAAGSGLAGLAGVIGGFALLTAPDMANALGPIVFVVVVVGGLGALAGALIASLLIGILQTFLVALDVSIIDAVRALGIQASPGSIFGEAMGVKVAQVAPMVPYLLLTLMLILRPRGLLGTRDT
jgi:branched-chain amino acid transport system permease protein